MPENKGDGSFQELTWPAAGDLLPNWPAAGDLLPTM